MKKMFKLFLLTVILCFTSISVSAANNDVFAKITKIEGSVSIKRRRGTKTFKATKGMKLVQGDMLYTSKNSNVALTFSNGNQSVLGENSSLTFDELKKLPHDKNSVSMNLNKGSIFSNVKKKLTNAEKFEIKTPNAVAGVRGTKFFIKTDKKGSVLYVVKGKVKFKSFNKNNSKPVFTKKNQMAKVKKNDAATLIEDDKSNFNDGNNNNFEKQILNIKKDFSKNMLKKAEAFSNDKDSLFKDDDNSEYMSSKKDNKTNDNSKKKKETNDSKKDDTDKNVNDKKDSKNNKKNIVQDDKNGNINIDLSTILKNGKNTSEINKTDVYPIPPELNNNTPQPPISKVLWNSIDGVELTLNGSSLSNNRELNMEYTGVWKFVMTVTNSNAFSSNNQNLSLIISSALTERRLGQVDFTPIGNNQYNAEISISQLTSLSEREKADLSLIIKILE